MLTHLAGLYLSRRFFVVLGIVAVLSALGFAQPLLYHLARLGLVVLLGWTLYDAWLLYRAARAVSVTRQPPKLLSLGDEMRIRLLVDYRGELPVSAEIVDELPGQLQLRDHRIVFSLDGPERKEVFYTIRPLERGSYGFGVVNLFLQTRWRLVQRRVRAGTAEEVPVYPSVVQMHQFALRADTSIVTTGRQRLRQLTRSYEFDQIKEYVVGDDHRSINWKATSRRNELMVNQYEEERAQRIYCVLDKGRTMLMPFGGMSLLDYAINAALALSNVILKREDRAGLLTFSDKLGTVVPADSKPDQLRRILEALYREEERETESNYDLLYYGSRRLMGGRSLLLLFTNFESNYALDRVLPGLRRIGRAHQVVVVLFENTEVADMLDEPLVAVEDAYRQHTARSFLQTRQLMAARLRQNGIHVVLTRPEELTGAVINKYLEMKARGAI